MSSALSSLCPSTPPHPDDIYVMSPVLAEDSVLLTLPFGGAVLQSLGVSKPEIDAILEDFRKILMEEDKNFSDDTFDFLNSFKKKMAVTTISESADNAKKSDKVALISEGSDWTYSEEQNALEEIKIKAKAESEEQEMLLIEALTEEEIPDYLDGSDLVSSPHTDIDLLDAAN